MFKRVKKDKYFCGIDVGSDKVKIGVLERTDNGRFELLGLLEKKTYGFKNGAVSDLSELSECIHDAVNKVSEKTGVKIDSVYLGVNAMLCDFRRGKAVIPLVDKGSKIIALRDIKNVTTQARLLGTKMEEEVLHDLPQNYIVDDVQSAFNPVGLSGRKLGVQSLIIATPSARIRNVTKAVEEAGYDAENTYFSSYAASEVVLTDEDKQQGVIFLDVGSDVTSILIFKDKVLKYVAKLHMGGMSFTRQIAHSVMLPTDLAEEIKKSYAVATASDSFKDEEILVKRDGEYVPIKRERIYQAIEPIMQDFVTNIKSIIFSSDLFTEVNRGIVLTGGGALLPGFIERVSQEMNCPAQLGKVQIPTQKDIAYVATFSAVVGLAYLGYKDSSRNIISSNEHSTLAQAVVQKVKELYQEYF